MRYHNGDKFMKFHEVEFKYDAKNITLEDFITSCQLIGNLDTYKEIESYDHYYTSGDKFIRHRDGEHQELTVKEKTSADNNAVRIEVNLEINKQHNETVIPTFCALLGYKHNVSIYKKSYVFADEDYNTVFYIVYSDHLKTKELGRFIEIEANENSVWHSKEEAVNFIESIEQCLAPLGLNKNARLSKSLLEMYRN